MNNPNNSKFDEQMAGYILGDLSGEEYRELCDLPAQQRIEKLNELEKIASTVSLASIDLNEPFHSNFTGRSVARSYRLVGLPCCNYPGDRFLAEFGPKK
jgi:hypothetical protein